MSDGANPLTDPAWLAARVADTARRLRCDRRVAATMWWYSASSVLLDRPVVALLIEGRATSLTDVEVTLRTDGLIGAAYSPTPLEEGPAAFGREIRAAFTPIIAHLDAGRDRALWAIAADSLANRCLWSAAPEVSVEIAEATGVMPRPRFVDVGTRYVRRASCCLLYQAPGEGKCTSCPRRHPDDRLARLKALG